MSMLIPAFPAAQTGKVPEPGVVARFQGAVITQDELTKFSAADLERLELERAQFDAKMERARHEIMETNLARLLEGKLLQAEATKKGVSAKEVLDQALQGKVKEPTEEDARAYYEANKGRINQPLLQISGQIRQYLKSESYSAAKTAYIDQLKREWGATVYVEPLRASVETTGSLSRGPAAAPVTLVEFSDFQCPFCANYRATLQQVLEKYGDQVRLVFRNFPLAQIHPMAQKAAEAGLCAGDQGHFWEMHDLMFQTQGQLKEDDLKVKAAQLKLNMDVFNSCLTSGQNASRVNQDLIAGTRLGVSGTPALFINGRFLQGAVPFENIARIIDEELKSTSRPVK